MAKKSTKGDDGDTPDEKVLKEAKKRFNGCQTWESDTRKLFLDDLKFANADADNGYQWPNSIRRNRDVDERPCLTVNKTRQHNLQIVNDAKQNKPSVKIRPAGGGSSFDAAQVYEGVIRNIEYNSNAQVSYDTASKFQVDAGIGYWRIITDYVSDDSFDQEIFIRRIPDPLTVYLDPDIKEVDGSDARFGFIFDDLPREEFEEMYPEYKDMAIPKNTLGSGRETWAGKDKVRIAEYYRRVPKKDTLMAFKHPTDGSEMVMRASKVPEEIAQMVMEHQDTRRRGVVDYAVEWYLLVGDKVADKGLWAGKYVPIVRVIGEETVIDGKLDRKGHTRALKDPQRIYNYWTSSAVEFVALQSKTPYIAPAKAIEGYEVYWRTANRKNYSVLTYNSVDDEGNTIERPTRQEPPTQAPGYLAGMQTAQNEMMMVSGQYEANMGQQGNETSGKAINERQRQGDRATYHYIDNLAIGIRFTGKILIDLIPKIYDTPRVLRIMGEDGTPKEVSLDPQANKAYFEQKAQQGEEVKLIFNPNVGKYDVEADVGPAYATRREEAFNAFSQIAAQNPELMNVIGDLLFKNADFPGADEIAERMKRMVPAQAMGDDASPQLLALQGKLQNMQGVMEIMTRELAEKQLQVKSKEAQKEVNIYDAITKRLEVFLKNYALTPKDEGQMLHDMMREEHRVSLDPAADVTDAALDAERGQTTQNPAPAENAAPAMPPVTEQPNG